MNRAFKILTALGICLFVCLGCQPAPTPTGSPVTFQRAVSGNTIEVRWQGEGENRMATIRLMGITAPDLKQEPWGKKAQATLAQLLSVSGSTRVEFDLPLTPDRYGRYFGFVWQDQTLINEMMVKQGWALVEGCAQGMNLVTTASELSLRDKYCDRLTQAQNYARILEIGIWDPAQPLRQTPQEFRASKK